MLFTNSIVNIYRHKSSNFSFYLFLSMDHSIAFHLILTLNGIQHLIC